MVQRSDGMRHGSARSHKAVFKSDTTTSLSVEKNGNAKANFIRPQRNVKGAGSRTCPRPQHLWESDFGCAAPQFDRAELLGAIHLCGADGSGGELLVGGVDGGFDLGL